MRWWLLSVKIANMACVARHNVKLRAGRQKLCEGRKKLFQKPRDGRWCQALGHEAKGLANICMRHQPSPAWFSTLSCPSGEGTEKTLGTEPRLST